MDLEDLDQQLVNRLRTARHGKKFQEFVSAVRGCFLLTLRLRSWKPLCRVKKAERRNNKSNWAAGFGSWRCHQLLA